MLRSRRYLISRLGRTKYLPLVVGVLRRQQHLLTTTFVSGKLGTQRQCRHGGVGCGECAAASIQCFTGSQMYTCAVACLLRSTHHAKIEYSFRCFISEAFATGIHDDCRLLAGSAYRARPGNANVYQERSRKIRLIFATTSVRITCETQDDLQYPGASHKRLRFGRSCACRSIVPSANQPRAFVE